MNTTPNSTDGEQPTDETFLHLDMQHHYGVQIYATVVPTMPAASTTVAAPNLTL